jgi:hypothetical protein
MTRISCARWTRWICAAILLGHTPSAAAQTLSHRGFVEGTAFGFPQDTQDDSTQLIGDLLAREEVSLRPARWFLFAGGVDLRANSDDQVDDSWQLDFSDRGRQRPRLSTRRLVATLTRGPFTLDLGKQFVRWGKTDIIVPTDRFAPRDFLTVIDAPYLAITAARATVQFGGHMVEAVWAPRFTPSRIPLLEQRWTVRPASVPRSVSIVETPPSFPTGSQAGIRWGEIRGRVEYSVSFYDGFNHLPDIRPGALDVDTGIIEFSRTYPPIRTYGADSAIPLRWFTLKTEAAYFTSSSPTTDEYVLYVVQVERQTGEWVFVAGYAGEAVTERRSAFTFAPDRGLSRAVLGRMSYTIDSNRAVELEAAARQDGKGVYAKAEYSQARGQNWRTTVSGVFLGGDRDDFIGQYRRNSQLRLSLRYSF